mgnify:CR=1 FL=1
MCLDCGWPDLLEDIESMLEDDRYRFASETLEGIHEWVENNEYCTDGQKEAVENIKGSVR